MASHLGVEINLVISRIEVVREKRKVYLQGIIVCSRVKKNIRRGSCGGTKFLSGYNDWW